MELQGFNQGIRYQLSSHSNEHQSNQHALLLSSQSRTAHSVSITEQSYPSWSMMSLKQVGVSVQLES